MDAIERLEPIQGNRPFSRLTSSSMAALVLVLEHKLRRGLLEGSRGPDAVDLGLSGLFHHSREVPFCFFELSCASALANSPPEDALVDVPDPGPHDEAGYSFASHDLVSFPSGTPVAGLIVVDPSVEFKAVEADTLLANGDFGQIRPHLGVEAVAVHAEVARRITKADDPRNQGSRLKMVTVGALPSLRRTETSPASSSHANPRYFALRSRPNRRMALFEKATT